MLTVDELKVKLNLTEDLELAKAFGITKQAVSNWRVNGVPAKIELKARDMIDRDATVISGDNNHISIHHVAEPEPDYSPATVMILDVIKDWDEVRRRKLAAKIVMMNGDEKGD